MSDPPPRPPLDRHFWIALLIAALVVIPRSLLITASHSPTQDEQTHLRIGLSNLTGNPSGLINAANDAPLGQILCAIPMLATGSLPAKPMNPATLSPNPLASDDPHDGSGSASPELRMRLRAARRDVLFGHHFSPDTLRLIIAAWKALLFLPAAGLIFHWCRWLYGLPSAWLALSLVLIDPTFAAFIPPATPDVLAVEGLLFACYFTWRVMEDPTRKRLLLPASIFTAAALLLKLTTIILPAVLLAIAAAFAVHRDRFSKPAVRRRWNILLAGSLLTCLSIWTLTGFDIAAPAQWIPMPADKHSLLWLIYPALQHPWPAGHYIQVLCAGFDINASLRSAYLLGQANNGGWWYYFPVVAACKIPLGYFIIFLAAILSLLRFRPRFNELSLAIPLLAWTLMLLFLTHINTGFRHFLPAYVFILMLASRSLAQAPRALWQWIIWTAAGASFLHTLTYHPDYLSYFNRPLEKPWLICNDSNIDWGQQLKQVRQWLDAHPTNRPVYLRYDWDDVWIQYYLGDRVHRLKEFVTPPTSGLLIISPVWEAGYWDPGDGYAFLRPQHPIDLIGHSMPVYDLDAIRQQSEDR